MGLSLGFLSGFLGYSFGVGMGFQAMDFVKPGFSGRVFFWSECFLYIFFGFFLAQRCGILMGYFGYIFFGRVFLGRGGSVTFFSISYGAMMYFYVSLAIGSFGQVFWAGGFLQVSYIFYGAMMWYFYVFLEWLVLGLCFF